MSATEKKPPKQKNTHLIVLAAVAGLVALLLFLDAFVPILPDSMNLGGGHSEGDESRGETGEDETKKHWWEGIFDRNEPKETEPPAEDFEPVPRPTPDTDEVYYTEDEMQEWYKPLVTALYEIAEQGYEWGSDWNRAVGLFDVDADGTPEILVETDEPQISSWACQYRLFDLYSCEEIGSFDIGSEETRLTLYRRGGSYEALLYDRRLSGFSWAVSSVVPTSEYWYAVERQAETTVSEEIMFCGPVASDKYSGSVVLDTGWRVRGEEVSKSEFTAFQGEFFAERTELDETRMLMQTWESTPDAGHMADALLTSGQKFIKP